MKEERRRQLRTRMLAEPTSDVPENIDATLAHLDQLSQESVDRKDQLGFKALWAMLADEAKLRNVLLRRLKGIQNVTDQQPTAEMFDRIYAAYLDILHHAHEAPAAIAENITGHALLKRVADLEAHHHLYLGHKTADPKMGEAAFKHLWLSYLEAGASGKASEVALIGLLRYGPKAYAGAQKDQMIPIDTFTPFVEFTLPREDVLGAVSLKHYIADTSKRDLLIYVPGSVNTFVTFDLGIGGQRPTMPIEEPERRASYGRIKTGPGGLNMSDAQLCKLWAAIGNDTRMDMPSGEERTIWRDVYKEVIEDILRRIPTEQREAVGNLLLPRTTRFYEKHPAVKNYNPDQLKYDKVFNLAAIRIAWPQVINKAPGLIDLVGATITVSNWEVAKRELINMHRTDPTHPALAPFFPSKPQSIRRRNAA